MNYSPALRWIIILLFPLSLGWKLAAADQSPHKLTEKMVEFLTHQQFDVVVTDQMNWNDFPLIHATAGACHMVIAEASPDGWNREIIHEHAKAMDRFFVVYRGTIYTQQPTWLTVTHYWWSRYVRKIGLVGHEMPVIAVMETASCNGEQLPWVEI